MGRSVTTVTPEFLHSIPVTLLPSTIKNPIAILKLHLQEGKLYQSEFQLDTAGHEVFRDTHPVEWIVGADANGLGALIRHNNYIFEAPLSYYKRAPVAGSCPPVIRTVITDFIASSPPDASFATAAVRSPQPAV